MTVTPLPAEHIAQVNQVCNLIRECESFLVIGHLRPDADCIGSQLGVALGLKAFGKKVQVYNVGPIPRSLMNTAHLDMVKLERDPNFKSDCTLFVDCGGRDRSDIDFEPEGKVINIDHHASNDLFGDAHYVNIDATAAAEQVYDVLTTLGVALNEEICSPLFLGIMGDSGSFRFANTDQRTFEVATALVTSGANPSAISSAYYDTSSPGSLYLRGVAFSDLHFENEGRLCWAELDAAAYEKAGGEDHEPDGLVGEIRAIEGVEVSILIHEVPGIGARASFRSKGAVDVNAMAQELGGGGHHNASGCYIEGDYATLRAQMVEIALRHMGKQAF